MLRVFDKIFIDLLTRWKNQENDCRTNEIFKVAGVPTVCWVEDGAVIKRLQEEELFSTDMLEALFD